MRRMRCHTACFVGVNVIVYGLFDYMNTLLTENSRYLCQRPVLVNNQPFYAPPQLGRLAVIALKSVLASL